MKYRKKPIIIDAFRWTGDYDQTEDPLWLANLLREGQARIEKDLKTLSPVLQILTLEGVMTARVGDYIIKGIKGEVYPCRSDIFEESYEPMEGMTS